MNRLMYIMSLYDRVDLADVHASLRIANQLNCKRKYRSILVTILSIVSTTASSPQQLQRLPAARNHAAVKNRPRKMEVGLEGDKR
jgi:hypothetical protein